MTFLESTLFYCFVAVAAAALARISENGRTKVGLLLAAALLIFVSGFRAYSVGQDTIGYKEGIEYFYIYGQVMWNHSFSVPYGYFSSAVLHLWDNYTFLLVVEALITNALFVIRLWDFRDSISISFAMFVYATAVFPLSLCLICQMLAVSLVFFATRFLEVKKPLIFCIVCLPAVLIHTSALIGVLFLVYYLFSEKSGSKAQFAAKLFGAVLVVLIASYAGIKLFERYARYSINESNIGLMVFAQAFVFILAYYVYSQTSNKSGNGKHATRLSGALRLPSASYALGIIFSATSYVIANAGRIAYYFMVFGPVVFGGFVRDARCSKGRFFLACFLVVWFLLYAFYAYLLHTGLGIESYSFIWM
jgi:hypothetical protein